MSTPEQWIEDAADALVALDFADGQPNPGNQTVPLAIQSLAAANGLSAQRLYKEVMQTKARDLARQYARQDQAADYNAQFLDLDDLDALPSTRWFIDGLLPEGYVLLSGRDASFKTFIALDMVLSVAAGILWRGKATKQTRVLYVAGEGAHGLKQRVASWLAIHPEVARDDLFKWLTVRKAAPNFYAGGPPYDDLIARAGGYGVVVLDTLRRISGGADGNGSDMALVVDRVAEVVRNLDNGAGGLALVLAHTQRTDTDTRGYTGIEDDADAVFHVVREGHALRSTLEVSKQKDGSEQGTKHALPLTPVSGSLAVDPSSSILQSIANETPKQRRERLAIEYVTGVMNIGATLADVERALSTDCSRTTAQRTASELLGVGRLVKVGQRYYPGTATTEATALGFEDEGESIEQSERDPEADAGGSGS